MCKISGPFQKNSTDWTVARKKISFKKPLTEFCIKSQKDDSVTPFFNRKVAYANSKDTSYNFKSQNSKVFCTEQVNCCNHEEADRQMFDHLFLVATPSNTVIIVSSFMTPY